MSEGALRQYNLSFDRVAGAVRTGSLDLPGGIIKAEGGEVLIRAKGQRYTGEEFGQIVVITAPDGTAPLLSPQSESAARVSYAPAPWRVMQMTNPRAAVAADG